MGEYQPPNTWNLDGVARKTDFNEMLMRLKALNIKYLSLLLEDLNTSYCGMWSGEYHTSLIRMVEGEILERTMLNVKLHK